MRLEDNNFGLKAMRAGLHTIKAMSVMFKTSSYRVSVWQQAYYIGAKGVFFLVEEGGATITG